MSFRARLMVGFLWLAPGWNLFAAGGDAVVRIEVRSAGAPVGAAYIALVPDERPWSQPLEETVADPAEVQWSVPPGKYRWVVGAPGYWWEKSPAFDLEAGAGPRRETVELRRLGRAKGRVTTPQGEPIAGARVGDLYAFLASSRNRLSALGEKHLAGNWEARTRSDGTFELPALEGHRFSALVEARGYEPGLIDNHLLRAEAPEFLELRLGPGASLKVEWAAQPNAAPGFFQLKPQDRAFLSRVPMVVPEWIWERPAVGGSAEWVALPAGDYTLYWIGAEPVQKPVVRLGQFKLAAGRLEERKVQLPAAPVESEPPAVAGGPLSIRLEGELPPLFEQLEVKTLTDQGWRTIAPKLVRSAGGPRIDLDSGRQPGARLLVAAKGRFGATAELEPKIETSELAVQLWPRADLRGQLQSPTGEKKPARGLLRAMSCPLPGELHRELVSVPIEIEPSGAWRSPIPSGCTCLVLEAAGFAALSWHKVETHPGEVHDAGSRKLAHGAHLLVRLANAVGEPVGGAQVDVLFPEEAESLARRGSAGGGHIASLHRASSAPDGWAELQALPAGRYVLRAVVPGSHVPVFSQPIELAADQREVIDPWTFPAPGSLDLRLKARKAAWEDYQVVLEADSGQLAALRLEGRPDDQGRVRFLEVAPGPVTLRVFYRAGGSRNEVAVRNLQIRPAEETRQEIPVDAQQYRVQMMRGAVPLLEAGRVELFPKEGASTPISAKIDEEGKFEIRLPRPGTYSGRFFLPELERRIVVPEIRFEDAERITEIELPGGRIEGVVVGEGGAPVEHVSVMAEKIEEKPGSRPVIHNQITPADELGRFLLDFLPEGSWKLSARSLAGKSRQLEIVLAPSEEKKGIVLRLEPLKQLRGRVLAASGQPVAGAQVFMQAASTAEPWDRPIARTSLDGSFSFETPEGQTTGGAFWIVFPGGLVAYQRTSGEDVILTAPAASGELRLAPAESPESWALETEDGSSMNWGWLAPESGDRHSLRLAPGIWKLRRQDASAAQIFEVEPGKSLLVDPPS